MNTLYRHNRTQRGQATTEFIAAMALFVPLILGVIYIGKFSDVKHQAIQASRYAAMQRALDPQHVEGDATLEGRTIARFFRDGSKYVVGQAENAMGATAGDVNANWYDVTGKPLLDRFSDISVKFGTASAIASGPLTALKGVTLPFNKLDSNPGFRANVEIPIANLTHFAPLSNLNLKIGASTVIAGDSWSSASASDVADHLTRGAVPAKFGNALPMINKLPGLDTLFRLLAGAPAPKFGCVKPDIVPGEAAPGAQYNPGDPSNGNDQCL